VFCLRHDVVGEYLGYSNRRNYDQDYLELKYDTIIKKPNSKIHIITKLIFLC
jgi:hypothetical protein